MKKINFFSTLVLCAAALFLIQGGVSAQAAINAEPRALGPNTVEAPFYSCKRNFYVATTGSDSAAGGRTTPWRTIQHADQSSRKPGDCINVAAGTYTTGVTIRHGGNAPTPTGYVVYRCQALDRCHILANGGGHLWGITDSGSFTVIDGFELDGNNALQPDGIADACIGSDNATYGVGQAGHHIWVMNNIIHHCNLAGIDLNNKEWYYVLNNTVYHNAYTSGYQGSGIGLVVIQCIEKGVSNCASGGTYNGGTGTYTPSGMDLTYASPYHIVIRGNIVHDNKIAPNNPVPCGSHTDGNGIILDTFLDEATNTVPFPYRTLVTRNVTYANGGRGIHVFRTSNATVANNTAFANGTDTCINAYYLADLSQAGGSNNIWVNNIAQAVLTAHNAACGSYCGARNAPMVAGDEGFSSDSNNSYANNVLYGAYGPQMFNNDQGAFSCTKNKCKVNPRLTNPDLRNFALMPSSPAVGYALSAAVLHWGLADAGACLHTLSICPARGYMVR